MTPENKKKEEQRHSTTESPDEASWAADQQQRSYYYDDSYGYEVYIDEDDTEGEEGEKSFENDSFRK
jgi:hypothetical protein